MESISAAHPAQSSRVLLAAQRPAIAQLAARQHGLVSYEQLRATNLSAKAIARASDAGYLHRVFKGVYSVGHRRVPNHLLPRAAWLAAAPGTVVSHATATALMNLGTLGGDVHLTSPGPRRRREYGVVVHRCPGLEPADITVTNGLPHTTVARSLLDRASTTAPQTLDRLLDEAAGRNLIDLVDFERVMTVRPRTAGKGKLEDAIGRLTENAGRARSEFERRAMELCRLHGIAEPTLNGLVIGLEVDLSWHWTRAIIELDGFRFHRTPAEVVRDLERRIALEAAGFSVLRLTWFEVVHRSSATARRIREHLAAHRI